MGLAAAMVLGSAVHAAAGKEGDEGVATAEARDRAGVEVEELADGGGGGDGSRGGKKKRRTGKRRGDCFDLRQTGTCTRGDNCPFTHGTVL